MTNNFQYQKLGIRTEISINTLMLPWLKEMFENNTRLYDFKTEGYTTKNISEIEEIIKKFNIIQLFSTENVSEYYSLFKTTDNKSLISFSTTDYKYIFVNVLSLDVELINKSKEIFSNIITNKIEEGQIFAISRSDSGTLMVSKLGLAGSKLERGNYTKQVVQDYLSVVEDLKSSEPSGRLSILEGVPGSGKSYLIRGLLSENQDAMFVIVPPHLVSSLSDPDFISLLARNRYQASGPVVLLIEDADTCLIKRSSDNISAISSILNLCDGILGSLFDIRIIATTNAKKLEMDQAIVRAGRLNKLIEVGMLDYNHSVTILNRLLNKNEKFYPGFSDKNHCLADIYDFARRMGWKPPPREKRKQPLFHSENWA